nr:MAG TPA: hypothetical protein [Caudoviricetes sp.]
MFKIVLITKSEALKLNKMGVCWGYEGISHTYSNSHTYYLAETKNNMRKLKEMRSSTIVK